MKIKYAFLVLVFLAFLVLPLAGQAVSYLSTPLLDKFIKTYPALQNDLQNLDESIAAEIDLSAKADDFEPFQVDEIRAYIKTVANHAAIKAILAKHGWGGEFWDVLITIAYANMYLELQSIMKTYSNDEMVDIADRIGSRIHPADRTLVAGRMTELQAVMGE